MTESQAGPASPTAPFAETLQSRSVYLRPVVPEDHRFLYQLELSLELSGPWRGNGRTASPEDVIADLWRGVLAQFVVIQKGTGTPLGLVKVYDASLEHGFAYLYVAGSREAPQRSPMVEAAIVLISYTFRRWPFRKLYALTIGDNYLPLSSGLSGLLVEEARLASHVRIAGRYADQVTYAIYRAGWERIGRYLARFLPPQQRIAGTEPHPQAPTSETLDEVTFEDLMAELQARRLLPEQNPMTPHQLLGEDLGLSDLDVKLIAGFLYDFGGVDLPDELLADLQALEDVYHYYKVRRAW